MKQLLFTVSFYYYHYYYHTHLLAIGLNVACQHLVSPLKKVADQVTPIFKKKVISPVDFQAFHRKVVCPSYNLSVTTQHFPDVLRCRPAISANSGLLVLTTNPFLSVILTVYCKCGLCYMKTTVICPGYMVKTAIPPPLQCSIFKVHNCFTIISKELISSLWTHLMHLHLNRTTEGLLWVVLASPLPPRRGESSPLLRSEVKGCFLQEWVTLCYCLYYQEFQNLADAVKHKHVHNVT